MCSHVHPYLCNLKFFDELCALSSIIGPSMSSSYLSSSQDKRSQGPFICYEVVCRDEITLHSVRAPQVSAHSNAMAFQVCHHLRLGLVIQ